MDEKERQQLEEQLSAYMDGELTPAERQEVEAFLDANPKARALLKTLQGTADTLRLLPRAKAPDDLMESMRARLERKALLGEEQPIHHPRLTSGTPFSGRWIAAAAVIAMTVVGGYLMWSFTEREPQTVTEHQQFALLDEEERKPPATPEPMKGIQAKKTDADDDRVLTLAEAERSGPAGGRVTGRGVVPVAEKSDASTRGRALRVAKQPARKEVSTKRRGISETPALQDTPTSERDQAKTNALAEMNEKEPDRSDRDAVPPMFRKKREAFQEQRLGLDSERTSQSSPSTTSQPTTPPGTPEPTIGQRLDWFVATLKAGVSTATSAPVGVAANRPVTTAVIADVTTPEAPLSEAESKRCLKTAPYATAVPSVRHKGASRARTIGTSSTAPVMAGARLVDTTRDSVGFYMTDDRALRANQPVTLPVRRESTTKPAATQSAITKPPLASQPSTTHPAAATQPATDAKLKPQTCPAR